MLPREDDLPQDEPHYFDPPPEEEDAPPPPPPPSSRSSSGPVNGSGSATGSGSGVGGRGERLLPVDAAGEWAEEPLPPPPALASGPNVGTILQGLKRRWWLALGLGLLLAGPAAVAAWLLLEPPHTAFAQIHVKTVQPWIVDRKQSTPEHRNEFVSYKGLQSAHIRGRRVLNATLIRPEVKNLEILKHQPDPLLWLEEQIRVESQEISEVMTISMTGPDPEAARTIVNGVRESYFEEVVKEERKGREDRFKELEKIVDEAETALRKKKDQYNQLSESIGSSDPGVVSVKQLNLTTMLSLKRVNLVQAQMDQRKAETRLKLLQDQQSVPQPGSGSLPPQPEAKVEVDELVLAEAITHDGRAQYLEQVLRVARDRYERCRKHLYDGEPELAQRQQAVQDAQAALQKRQAEVKTAVLEAMKRQAEARIQGQAQAMPPGVGQAVTIDQARAEVAMHAQNAKDLQAEVDSLTRESEMLNRRSTDLERLRDDIRGETTRLEGYKNELESLKIELRPGVPPRVTKFQDAGLQRRDTKRQVLGAAVVPVMVLLASAFAVGWWESRARRIHSADEVARGLGVRVVGAMPALPRGRKDEEAFEDMLLESVDSIRTLLLREANRDALQVVMVTSAASGEGKTTLASQLAGSLARAGRRTLLIDCDLRNPTAHQLFELPLQPGLSEVLMDEAHIAEATLATEVDGLWVVPAGQWDREVIQAVARGGLRRALEKLRQAYDFIVVDSHPVLAATDSLLIGQHADAVLLAVMREVSQAPKVYAALQRLAGLHIRVLGAVVSGLPEPVAVHGACPFGVPALRG